MPSRLTFHRAPSRARKARRTREGWAAGTHAHLVELALELREEIIQRRAMRLAARMHRVDGRRGPLAVLAVVPVQVGVAVRLPVSVVVERGVEVWRAAFGE